MFIRVKSSPNSPRKSVQICESYRDSSKVRQRIVRHIGIADNELHLEELKKLAQVIKEQIHQEQKGPFLFDLPLESPTSEKTKQRSNKESSNSIEKKEAEGGLFVNLSHLKEKKRNVEGFHDVFGKIFQELGFDSLLNKSQTTVLQDVLLARIAMPSSKRHTSRLLSADFGRDVPVDRIYRMMDSLIEKKDQVQKQVFHSTQSLCFNKVNLVLFDVTTLYFESTEDDELRNFGYSKDQKFHMTQVVLALATASNGLPVGYRLFPGNTAEVSTLLCCLEEWKKILPIEDVIFVADRAMMSEANLQALEEANIKYIIAAKLKKMRSEIKSQILKGPRQSKEEEDQGIQDLKLPDGRRLVVSHSLTRALKDLHDRENGLKRMQKKIGKGKNLKQLIPNYGYQKFLKTEGEGKLVIDEIKVHREEEWDGFHGVITNCSEIGVSELLSHYRRLWVIEESFRIQKHNLSVRPIYHFKQERIEAHILMCFMAFTLIRHLEYRVGLQQEKITINEMQEELWRVQSSILEDEHTKELYRIPSSMPPIAKKIYQAFGLKRSQVPEKLEM